MRRTLGALLGLPVFACAGAGPLPAEEPPEPSGAGPVAPVIFDSLANSTPAIRTRRDDTADVHFGVRVPDPYRWLEADSAAVGEWTEQQNEHLERSLGAIAARPSLHARLSALLAIGTVSHPTVKRLRGGKLRYFHQRRDASQDQPVLLYRDGVDGEDRALIDPNALSADRTTSLDWYHPSSDGSLVAYGLSEGGSELSTLRVRVVATGKDLPDTIEHTRFSSVCWAPTSKRFYYARFPAPGTVPKGEETYHRKIFEHTLGADPARDPVVFAPTKMTDFPSCVLSPDGRWLVVHVHQGWSKNELWLADTTKVPLKFVPLAAEKEQRYRPIVTNSSIWITTDEGAPRGALWAVDPRTPERTAWRLVLPEHATDVLEDVHVVGDQVLTAFQRDAVSRLERFDTLGKSRGAVPLPTVGTSDGFSGIHDGSEAFFNFESFADPERILRIDLASGATSPWATVTADVRSDEFTVTPGTATSKDGTAVPFLAVHAKNVTLNGGKHPLLLYGYGGFNQSLQPRFSRSTYAFLEKGGVYVQANLRGGGEQGEAWHRGGQLEKKQNVFDDFIAVAAHLIDRGATTTDRLAILGRSNGGLLVAAAITQRPDLFRAAVSGVPLTDMLRYHRFLIAKLWIPEYGDPGQEDAFRWLHAYSPYHRVREGTRYPAVLFTTAEGDSRVHPLHARKMAAALQWATASDRPVLLRTELRAGHGAGKPVSKQVDELTDVYAFIMSQLGMIDGGDP